MNALSIAKSPYSRLLGNLAYAVGNCTLGFLFRSWWFVSIGAYYAVLSTTRFSVLMVRHKAKGDLEIEQFASVITGILLIALSICIVGVNILSAVKDRGKMYHEIIMIAIATYTFTKITVAIIGMTKARHAPSPVHKTLRNISMADACVSVYSMQRSMLVSFPGMAEKDILLLNVLTGAAVFFAVLFLGINLIRTKRSKLPHTRRSHNGQTTGKDGCRTGSVRTGCGIRPGDNRRNCQRLSENRSSRSRWL